MGETEIECRLARSEDWTKIWRIFSDVVAKGDTYAYAPDINEDDARSAWMFEGPGRAATYVATAGKALGATAYLKPNQPGLGDHVANAGWMVAPSFEGQGIGRTLAHYVIEEARRVGYLAMQFNAVVATNTRAIQLWESLGFSIVGTVPDAFRHSGEGLVPVHIMYADLRA